MGRSLTTSTRNHDSVSQLRAPFGATWLALFAALSLLTGCGVFASGSAADASIEQRLGPVQVVAKMRPSVVTVEAGPNLGTGFFVSPRLVATNLHVVSGQPKIEVTTAARKSVPVLGVIAYDPDHDLVVLDLGQDVGPPLAIGDPGGLQLGAPLVTLGNPEGLEASVSTGIVSGLRRVDDKHWLIQMTAPISRGSSGGPVVDERGMVVGVASFYLRRGQNLNFAIPSTYLTRLLQLEAWTPLSLGEFTARTRAKSSGTAKLDAAARSVGFPAHVAGFEFGSTKSEIRDLCPTVTATGSDQSTLYCPFLPVDIAFASGPATLHMSGGRLVRVILQSYELDRLTQALQAKYGQPDSTESMNEQGFALGDWDTGKGRSLWRLAGGSLVVGSFDGETYLVVYTHELKQKSSLIESY